MRSRKSRNSIRRTRKARGLTVESLHASFERIDAKIHGLISKGATDAKLACCLQKSWQEQFHTPASAAAVKALILHYRALHGSKRKTRKQKGGMAALDYVMGPGLAHYGGFPVPVPMGTTSNVLRDLDLGRFYESNAGRSCNTSGGHNALNQRGGATPLANFLAPSNMWSSVSNGHVPPSVPTNMFQTSANAVMGGTPIGSSASPVAASVPLSSYTSNAYPVQDIAKLYPMGAIYKA